MLTRLKNNYLECLRKTSYYRHQNGRLNLLSYKYNQIRLIKLSYILGFSIGFDSLGYGYYLPHHGTIVIGDSNLIGKYSQASGLLILVR